MTEDPDNLEYNLLLRLRNDDHEAFSVIYDIYKLQLTANLLRLLRSADLAEEVIQDTFVSLWENRNQINISKPLKPYLYTIAANKTRNVFRKAASDTKLKGKLLSFFDESYNPILDNIFKKEYALHLENLLGKLTAQQQMVYRLCKLEKKSYQEVSEILGISEGTVNVHIREANKKLKALLTENSDLIFILLLILSSY